MKKKIAHFTVVAALLFGGFLVVPATSNAQTQALEEIDPPTTNGRKKCFLRKGCGFSTSKQCFGSNGC